MKKKKQQKSCYLPKNEKRKVDKNQFVYEKHFYFCECDQ